MKHVLFFALLIAFATPACAQTGSARATLSVNDVLRGDFTETRHMHGFKTALTTKGRFTVAPNYGLIWDVKKPFTITTAVTPNGLRQSIDGQPVTTMNAAKMPFLGHLYETLSGALMGNIEILKKDFTVTEEQNGGTWTINLQPLQTNAAMPFNSVTITGDRFVENVHIVQNSGDIDDIAFHNQAIAHGTPTDGELKDFGASGS